MATHSNRVDRFEVNFPGQPKVEEIKWPSEYGAVFPGTRVFGRTNAARTNHTEADSLPIYWHVDVQASIAYAATKFRQRPGVKVTYDAFHYIDLVSGHQLQMTNPDQSRLDNRRALSSAAGREQRMPARFHHARGRPREDV